MNQSPDAFDQVKAILGKLDRSITEARSRRLGKPLEAPASPPTSPAAPPAEHNEPTTPRPAALPQPTPAAGYAKLRGQFGRAKPIAKPGNGSWNPGNH